MKIKITAKKQLTIFAITASVSLLSVGIVKVVQASSAQMLKRAGSNFCLNANRPGQGTTVNLWGCDSNDPDQKWEKVPVTTGTNTKLMIKRVGSDFCLNAYRPGQSSKVNLWKCDVNDPDQKWEDIGNQMFKRAGSNFCLNAYRPGQGTSVNLWGCDAKDGDQKWENLAPSGSTGNIDMPGLQRLLFGNVTSTVTSPYGFQDCSIAAWKKYYADCKHPALDIAGPENTPIYSPIEGVVIIRKDDIGEIGIYNQKSNTTFFFLHMNRTDVSTNQTVKKGQQVGIEGTKGDVTGAHLHFEARPGKTTSLAGDIKQTVNPLDAVNQANR